MKKIIFIDNKRARSSLNALPLSGAGRRLYAICGDDPMPGLQVRMTESGFEQKSLFSAAPEIREKFIKEFIDLTASLGRANAGSRWWWATDVASKNRFASRLPQALQQFIEILSAARAENFEYFMVLDASPLILSALKEALSKEQIEVICLVPEPGKVETTAARIRKVFSTLFHAARLYGRAVYARRALGPVIRQRLRTGTKYYVLRSCVYNSSFSQSGYRDAFFGSLPDFLRGKRNVLVLADVMGNYRYCIQRIAACEFPALVPWEYFVSLRDVMKAVKGILMYKPEIPADMRFFDFNVSAVLRNELRRTYNGIAIYQALNYEGLKGLLKKIEVETFVLPYENNPWEKMCLLALKENSPMTKIIGYQHNVVPQSSVNMFMSQKEEPVIPRPQVILTTGDIPRQIMARYGNFNETVLRPACALRQEYLFRLQPQERRGSKKLLLALEGIFDVYHLVNYVLSQLSCYKDYQILIRTHPVLPIKLFRHKLHSDLASLNNVLISDEVSLKKDIERSDIIIYWGSTVSMEALWMGKPVIHYDNGNILSYDPLFDCPYLKWTVRREDSLIETLRKIESLGAEEFERQRQKAAEYLSRYFYPVEPQNLTKFLL